MKIETFFRLLLSRLNTNTADSKLLRKHRVNVMTIDAELSSTQLKLGGVKHNNDNMPQSLIIITQLNSQSQTWSSVSNHQMKRWQERFYIQSGCDFSWIVLENRLTHRFDTNKRPECCLNNTLHLIDTFSDLRAHYWRTSFFFIFQLENGWVRGRGNVLYKTSVSSILRFYVITH